MKIVMIGPVYPFRGGISHYTSILSRKLREQHQVTNLSYSMQYPRFLYKREQKDEKNDSLKIADTIYSINTVNPISWLHTVHIIKKAEPDLVIFQWWHPFFAPCYAAILLLLPHKIRTMAICHNVLPHESFPFKRFFAKNILGRVSFSLVHSSQDAADLLSLSGKARYAQTVLPPFNTFNFSSLSKEDARRRLNIPDDQNVLLFFGFIREYKGLKHLIKAMPLIVSSNFRTTLLVVGDFFENNKDEYLQLLEENQAKKQIRIIDGYTPDSDIELYFSACDLVVLPYESATQSGIVQIAFSFSRPVVITNVGGLPDAVKHEKTGLIVPPKDPEALADAVNRFFSEQLAEPFSKEIEATIHTYSWESTIKIIEQNCEGVTL